MNRTKIILFAAIIIIIAASIFSYVFLDNNFLIRQWKIPLDPPGFRDAQQIGIAAESYARGYDPLKENLFTHEGYQGLNYPRIWQILFATGINQSHTNLLGSIFAILFLIGIGMFWFSDKFDNPSYFILSLVILSPPVMLGIERGNIELVVFFVIAAALFVSYYSSISSFCLLIFASVIKLYPVFAFVALLKDNKKKSWILFISACAIFIAYALITLDDLKQISHIQPRNAKSSYGVDVFWKGLAHPRLLNLHLSDDVIMLFRILSYLLLFLIFTGTLVLSFRTRNPDRFKHRDHIDAFRAGAGIYIGCFLLGSNYDQRLMFLIFTVPQLVAWLRDKINGISFIPLIALFAMGFSLWSYFIVRFLGSKVTFLIEEFANWVILATLLYLFFVSLPDWLIADLRQRYYGTRRQNMT